MCSPQQKCLTYLLVGKTGSGKSSTGNSILGLNAFNDSDLSTSETTKTEIKRAKVCGFNVTVVDTPGVMHTDLDLEEIKLRACNDMKEAVSKCPDQGKMAVVIVMKYGDRFTEENKTTVDILKQMFGEENLCKSCVIVMTHGDMFALKYQEEKQFKDWMAEQTEELGQLFSLVQYRCVLFNNKGEDSQEYNVQRQRISDLVETLDQGYTKTQFSLLKKQHQRLVLETEFPALQTMYRRKIEELYDSFQSMCMSSRGPIRFECLHIKLSNYLEELNKADDPRTIFYHEGEPRFFHKLREQLIKLEITVAKKKMVDEHEAEIDQLLEKLDFCIMVKKFDNIHFLDTKIESFSHSIKYNEDLTFLYTKLEVAKTKLLKAKRKEVKISLGSQIDELRNDVKKTKIPTLVSTFSKFLDRLNEIEYAVNEENQRLGKLEHLLEDVEDLQKIIKHRKEDNDIWIGWTATSGIMAGISVGTGFIPVCGPPISMAINVIPVIGRAIHTAVVSRQRSKSLDRM